MTFEKMTQAVTGPRPGLGAARRTAAPGAALAIAMAMALAVGGCAGSHVGDAWQCPLAQGEACASVAAVDPAVNGPAEPDYPSPGKTPDRGRNAPALEPGGSLASGPSSRCAGGCGPLAWIAGLFRADKDAAPNKATPHELTPASDGSGPAPDRSPEPVSPAAAGAGLRTPETIGRIWIAPYADDAGLFHEGRWVRVVIEPAGWRLK